MYCNNRSVPLRSAVLDSAGDAPTTALNSAISETQGCLVTRIQGRHCLNEQVVTPFLIILRTPDLSTSETITNKQPNERWLD